MDNRYQELMEKLNSAQRSAVEHLGSPLLVLAGPGTGKTQLLSSKVLYILENTDASPDNILCLTFTEFGASNMVSRLASFIGKDAYKITISTYHGFGKAIIDSYRNYSDRPVLDGTPIDDIEKYKIISDIQNSLPPLDILRGDRIKDILDTISEAKSARLTAEDLRTIASVNASDAAELTARIAPVLAKIKKGAHFDAASEFYYEILSILESYSGQPPILKSIPHLAEPLYYSLKTVLDFVENSDKPSISPLTRWRDKHFKKDAENRDVLDIAVRNKKLISLSHVMELYKEALERGKLYDFDDMIERAIEILRTDDSFRYTLAERYQYILLDEFQDTNPSQLEIVKLIADSVDSPDVMAVGDDDQAIYEFQGARANNFNHFAEHFHARTIVLTENYRSSQEILDLGRLVADQIPDSFVKQNNDIDKTLTAKNSSIPEDASITSHLFPSSDSEYYWVAGEIARLIDSGVPQKDIAVICSRHARLAPLVPLLQNLSTPSRPIYIDYEKRDNLLDDSRISELILMARYAVELVGNERTASRHILPILNFACFEIPSLTAYRTVSSAKENHTSILDALVSSDSEPLRKFANFFTVLASKVTTTPVEIFFNYLIGSSPIEYIDPVSNEKCVITSPFLDYYAKNSNSYETFLFYDNLTSFRNQFVEHLKSNSSARATDLIAFVDDCIISNTRIQSSSPYQNSENAVHLMSVHKSKGGEWPYVFLISTDDNIWGTGGGNHNLLVLPDNLAQIRHVGGSDGELLRSLFVAITRAKYYLYITSASTDFKGKDQNPLRYLASAGLPITTHLENATPVEISKNTDLKTFWDSAYFHPTGDLRSAISESAKKFTFSASAITSFLNLEYSGPRDFYDKYILGRPEPSSSSADFGNLVHETLCAVTRENLSDDGAIEYLRSAIEKLDLTPEESSAILTSSIECLTRTLSEFGEIVRAVGSRAEVSFYHEHLHLDDIALSGRIDHITIDEEKKTIELYDYKTSTFTDKNWESTPKLFLYALQLSFYKLLLNLSPTFGKYRVTAGHILFLTPDKSTDRIGNRVFTFTEESDKLLRDIIRALHAHIISLDFLDNPDIWDVKPSSSMKALREFIDLIIDTAPLVKY